MDTAGESQPQQGASSRRPGEPGGGRALWRSQGAEAGPLEAPNRPSPHRVGADRRPNRQTRTLPFPRAADRLNEWHPQAEAQAGKRLGELTGSPSRMPGSANEEERGMPSRGNTWSATGVERASHGLPATSPGWHLFVSQAASGHPFSSWGCRGGGLEASLEAPDGALPSPSMIAAMASGPPGLLNICSRLVSEGSKWASDCIWPTWTENEGLKAAALKTTKGALQVWRAC
jgi:hypothetical protein